MKKILKTVLILSLLLQPLMAEEVMKISLSGEVAEENLSGLSKIVFEDNAIVAGASYNLDEIVKIEFYDDNDVVALVSGGEGECARQAFAGNIGFVQIANQLQLTLSKPSLLSVSLYRVNGRKVAELFSGTTSAGSLSLSLTEAGLATGVYSVVVKADNTLFVRKLMIK